MISEWRTFDEVVLISAALNFIFFLIFHIVILRFFRALPTHRVILATIMVCGLGCIWAYERFLRGVGDFITPLQAMTGGILSVSLYGLLVFHYIAWFFGMGEAAIRIRLLQELDQAPGRRATLEQIYDRYNTDIILKTRLERLLGAGHLSFDGRHYRLKNQILTVQLALTNLLQKWSGQQSP